jgi:hypothetical protein
VLAVFRDGLTVVRHRMISAHPQIDVVVFAHAKRHVEPPGVQKAPAIIQNGPIHPDLVAPQECAVGIRSDIPADRLARYTAASVDKVKSAVDETRLRMANEALKASLDRTLAKPVVGVEKDDLIADRGS